MSINNLLLTKFFVWDSQTTSWERSEALRKLLYTPCYFSIKCLYIKGVLTLRQAAFTANVNCAGILASQLPRAFVRPWENGPHNFCFSLLPPFHESNQSVHLLPKGSSSDSWVEPITCVHTAAYSSLAPSLCRRCSQKGWPASSSNITY